MIAKTILIVLASFWCLVAKPQVFTDPGPVVPVYNSLYVEDYTHILTTRIYLSTKFNSITLEDVTNNTSVVYEPNNQVNLGFGFSYRAFTLNIGIGFAFLNQDDDVQGETSHFDAQANMYSKKLATNLFFQTYSGYHMTSHNREELGWPDDGTARPYRRDLEQSNIGFSSLYIFNNDRFSYRASFTQDAWQKKSAGSWLAGAYATYFNMYADSSLVPQALDDQFDEDLQIKRGRFIDFGLMGGYAYTLVIRKGFFATASVVIGSGLSLTRNRLELTDGSLEDLKKTSPGYSLQARLAIGWNSARNYVGISYNNESRWSAQSDVDRFGWSVGNFRFNYVHRFNKKVVPLDKLFDLPGKWFGKNG